MGECGCSQIDSIRKAVKIENYVLAITIYRGCEYCSTGVAVDLHLFTKDAAKELAIENSEIFEPDEYGSSMLSIPIVATEDLVEASKNLPSLEDYDSLPEWLQDNGLSLLQGAIHIRENKLRKEREELPDTSCICTADLTNWPVLPNPDCPVHGSFK